MKEHDIIKGEKPGPDAKSWYEFMWKEDQETPQRIEDAAKFLATMISLSLSIFLAVGQAAFTAQVPALVKAALILWLLSLFCSFFTLFPWRWRYAQDSLQSFKNVHKKIVRTKRWLLIASLALFIAALSILSAVLFFSHRL